jgi:hypothetical protein
MNSGGGVVGGCVVAGGGHGNGGNFFAVCTSFFALFSAGDICNCHSTAFSATVAVHIISMSDKLKHRTWMLLHDITKNLTVQSTIWPGI